MWSIINLKLLFSVFFALTLGVFGVSNLKETKKISLPSQERLALNESDDVKICSLETAEKNTALFVSCAGFLE